LRPLILNVNLVSLQPDVLSETSGSKVSPKDQN